MKRLLKIIGLVLVILLILLFCLLFTQPGNNILRPIIEKKATEASGIDIKLEKFSLRFSSIDVEALILGGIKAKVAGDTNLLAQSFDLTYNINADKLPEIEGIKIDEPLVLDGKVIGNLKVLNAYGAGDIFKSAVDFNVTLKDFNPTSIVANVNKLQIAKVLAIVGQPIYSDGLASANINITPNEKNEFSGNAIVSIENGVLSKDVLKKEFGLVLLKNPTYKLTSNFALQDSNDVVGGLELDSSLANLKTTNTKYNITSGAAQSGYSLNVPNLKELETLAGIPLSGAVVLYGDAKYAADLLQATLKSDNLAGGKLDAALDNDKLTANLANVKVEEILKILVQPSYAAANLNLKADISSIKDQSGSVDIALADGLVNNAAIKKEFNITLPKVDFTSKANADLKSGVAKFGVNFLSSLANIEKFDGTFDIGKTALNSNYIFNIKDLSKLDTVTGQKLTGSLAIAGDVKYASDTLSATAKSDNLAGGKLDVALSGDKLNASLLNAKLEDVLKIAAQSPYASGILSLSANIDSLAKTNGKINLDLTNGAINNETLKKEFNLSLPKSDFTAKSDVVMNNGLVDFDAKFLSGLANINKLTGTYDLNKSALKSNYQVAVSDLSKFNGVTGQKMVGSIGIDGGASIQNDILHVNGKSNTLGGTLGFDYDDSKLVVKGASLSSLEALKMLSYPEIFDAKVELDLNYDTKTSKGTFGATSPQGRLVETQLGGLIKALLNFDLSAEAYENILLKGNIDAEKIKFLFDMKNSKASLNVAEGKVNGDVLDIPFKLKVEKTDLAGRVTGKSDSPKVSIDSSEYLKGKAVQEIDKQIEKNGAKILDKLFKK